MTEQVAHRLQVASARHTYDPDVDIDWAAPVATDVYAKSPQRCTLYGTRLWEELTEEQRVHLSQQELAASAASGIWFELVLIQGLVRHVYDLDPTTERVQYALTEIADECRHCTMFAKAIARFDGGHYGPTRRSRRFGKIFAALAGPSLLFAGALYVEELADGMQREIMRDDSLNPLTRMVSRIHVVEEARHISFARDELARTWAAHGPVAKELLRWAIAGMALVATLEFIHPKVYRSVGLDPRQAWPVANQNPHWRRTKIEWARKAVAFFTELGVIAGPSKRLWRTAGVLPD
jgi:hypothetical protein